MRQRSAAFLVWIISFLPSVPAEAGSLIPIELTTVEIVDLKTIAERYDPTLEVPPSQLEKEISSLVEMILKADGISVSDTADQRLTVEIRSQKRKSLQKTAAFLVSLELLEPAVLTRKIPSDPGQEASVMITSWSDFTLVLVGSGDDYLEHVLEAVDDSATHFAKKVVQARSAYGVEPAEKSPK